MKKYYYLDDFEHRLLVGCLMTAQNEYIHEDKPIDDEPTERPIGIWGQRHLRHLKQHHKTVYTELMTSGKLNGYLADLNEQAEDMFLRLVKELAEKEGITETLKAKNQMLWVQRMNEVRETATKTVNNDLIYT